MVRNNDLRGETKPASVASPQRPTITRLLPPIPRTNPSTQLNMNVATQSLALSEATSSASRFSSLASKLSKFKKQAGKASVVEGIKYDWMREGLDLGEMGGKATKVMRAAAMQVRELVPRMLLEELECWEVLEEACGKSKSRESLEEQICRKVESKTSESKASESKTSESKAKEEAEAEDAHEVRKDTEAEDAPDAWDASDAPNAPDAHSVLKNTYHARLTEFKSVVSVLKSARASNKPVDKVTPLCAEMLLNVKEQFGEDGAGLRREYEEAIEVRKTSKRRRQGAKAKKTEQKRLRAKRAPNSASPPPLRSRMFGSQEKAPWRRRRSRSSCERIVFPTAPLLSLCELRIPRRVVRSSTPFVANCNV